MNIYTKIKEVLNMMEYNLEAEIEEAWIDSLELLDELPEEEAIKICNITIDYYENIIKKYINIENRYRQYAADRSRANEHDNEIKNFGLSEDHPLSKYKDIALKINFDELAEDVTRQRALQMQQMTQMPDFSKIKWRH